MESVKCAICKSEWRVAAMHTGQAIRPIELQDDGGECAKKVEDASMKLVTNACTSVCQNVKKSKSFPRPMAHMAAPIYVS